MHSAVLASIPYIAADVLVGAWGALHGLLRPLLDARAVRGLGSLGRKRPGDFSFTAMVMLFLRGFTLVFTLPPGPLLDVHLKHGKICRCIKIRLWEKHAFSGRPA